MNKFKLCEKLGQMAVIALLTASSNIALAQSDNDQDISNNGDWEFTLAPLFLWGMGINGGATIGDATAPLDLEFGDIFSNLETGSVDAKGGVEGFNKAVNAISEEVIAWLASLDL